MNGDDADDGGHVNLIGETMAKPLKAMVSSSNSAPDDLVE